ncbi:MAG TPA: DUF4143 domain-containing protein, partial [Candidatus Eisenbacteria bacterium]|nr:DUF4143 domain-containing protein [Candidatus Eisenbacteria bacterium]
AENLAFNVLSRWPGIVSLAYYREKQREVDFVVTLGGGKYLAVEVKYRRRLDDFAGLHAFMDQYPQSYGLIVGRESAASLDPRQITMPLHHFLLAFD